MSCLFYRRFVCFWSIGTINRASCCRLHTCRQQWFYGSSFANSKSDVINNQMEQRAAVSVGIKIPRFLRKIRDKEQIERYCLVKTLCLQKHFDTAVCYMKKWLEEEAATKSTILILNGLLHSLYKAERMEDVDTLKQIMDARNVTGDQATYVVLIDGYGKIKNSIMVCELLKEIMSLGWTPHDRSYVVAATLALERSAFSEAFSYFRKIKGVYKERLDEFCAQFIVGAAQTEQSNHVVNIFNDFKINRVIIGKKTLEAIGMYFESLSDSKWKTNLSKISSSGVCENCQRQLEELKFGKQEENLESYFKNVINLKLKGESSGMAGPMPKADFKTRDENKVLKLIKYLKSNGPFHVIMDGLNVAMHPTHGLDFNRLCSLVEYFANQGKQVLVVAANDLISPKTASVVEHQQTMMYLRRVSNVYLVKQNQSGIDDLFLIFAALNSFRQHSDVKLVSNDKFMDHRFKMTPQTASDFNCWLHAHQVMVKAYYDHASEEPLIQILPKYVFTVQNTHDSWHFPLDDRLWLCAERR